MDMLRVLNVLQRVRGVFFLMIVFSAVYAIEVSLAAFLGYPDVRTMLSVLSINEKRLVAFTIGPLLHQGNPHLVENLIFLLIFGAYVEWQVGLRRFLAFSALVGYGATWLLLSTGSVGAVGASSITNGLESITGFIGVARLAGGLWAIKNIRDLLWPAAHSIPFVIGFGFAVMAVQEWMSTSSNPTVTIHALGALIGAVIGLWYISRNHLREKMPPFIRTR